MTSRFSARITVEAGERTDAVFESLHADNRFYPENPARTEVRPGTPMEITIDAGHLPHLRAAVNSTLRLVEAGYESIGAPPG